MALSKFIPAITNFKEALFAGHFGPIGVGAVFYIEVALREIPNDGSRDRLRALYTPVVLFIVFSSVLAHGVTIPIAKLGPNVVRRTTSLSARRTVSFTSRPTSSRDVSPPQTSEGKPGHPEGALEREIWNPLWSAWVGLGHVVVFWRKDSFWRKENKHQMLVRQRGSVISAPRNAKRTSAIEERSAAPSTPSQQQQQQGEEAPSTPTMPKPAHVPSAAPHAGGDGPGSWGAQLQDALRREMMAERKEARDEEQKRVSRLLAQAGTSSRPLNGVGDTAAGEQDGGPATPGGSKVRFE